MIFRVSFGIRLEASQPRHSKLLTKALLERIF